MEGGEGRESEEGTRCLILKHFIFEAKWPASPWLCISMLFIFDSKLCSVLGTQGSKRYFNGFYQRRLDALAQGDAPSHMIKDFSLGGPGRSADLRAARKSR